jgi:hypothetical protein
MRDKKLIRDKLRDEMLNKLFKGNQSTWDLFSIEPDFIELRKYVDPKFELLFSKTYNQYIKGHWKAASSNVQKLLEKRPFDGPSINLNKVINIENGGIVPVGWKGYRALTSK